MNNQIFGRPNMFNGRLTNLDIRTTLAFARDFLREQTPLPSAKTPLGIAKGRILAEPVPLPNIGLEEEAARTRETAALRSLMSHICPAAGVVSGGADEDREGVLAGQFALPADTFLSAPQIGLLAAMGQADVWVRRKLPVSIMSVGRGLADAGSVRHSGQTFDAVRPILVSALNMPWVSANDRGIVADDQTLLRLILQQAAVKDRVILVGGMCGDQDTSSLKATIAELGGIVLVNSVQIAPGQSAFLATMGTSLLLALPGNPVGAWNVFNALGPEILRAAANVTLDAPAGWDAGMDRFDDAYPTLAAE